MYRRGLSINISAYSIFHCIYINNPGRHTLVIFWQILLNSPSQSGAPTLPHPVKDSEFLVSAQPWVFQVLNVLQKPFPDSTGSRKARLPIVPQLGYR